MAQDLTPPYDAATSPRREGSPTLYERFFTGVSGARLALHLTYFAFATVSLLLLCLLVPRQTESAPRILIAAFVVYSAALAARVVWSGRRGALVSLEPAHAFVPAILAANTVFAFNAVPAFTGFSPGSPDSMPGLHINQHIYFGAALVALCAFSGWHGAARGRLVETLLVAQIVLVSLMYERAIADPAALPMLMLTAGALAILRIAPLRGEAQPLSRSTVWIAAPLALFTAVALAASIAGAYPQAGLAVTGKLLALGVIALVLADAVRGDRQRWLVWASIVAPGVVNGALVVYKIIDIGRVMGFDYALSNRIELAAGVEVNPLGLSIAVSMLLLVGGLARMARPAMRALAVATIALLIPALVVTYSVGSLLGLMSGLAALAVFAVTGRADATERRMWLAPLAACGVIVLVIAASYTVVPSTRDGLRYTIEDPTTGRSRVQLWGWALDDARQHPVLGTGPTVYWPRASAVGDFPYRDVTQMLERRRLLGHDATQWRFLFVGHPHNLVLDVAEGMGALGVLALVGGAVAMSLAVMRVWRRRDPEARWFAASAVAMLVAVAAWSMGSVGVQVVILPLPLFAAMAMLTGSQRQFADPWRVPSWLRSTPARIAGMAIAVAVLAVFVVRPIGSMAWIAAAEERAADGDYDGAADAWRNASRFDPLDASVRLQLANDHLRRGEDAEALRRIREVNGRLSSNGAMLTREGEIAWLAGDDAAAERNLRAAIEADPWQALNADAYTPLGLLLARQGADDEARAAIADGLRVSPVNARDLAWVRLPSGDDAALDAAYAPGAAPDQVRAALQRRMFVAAGDAGPRPGPILLSSVLTLLEDEARLVRDPVEAAEIFSQVGLAYQYAGLDEHAVRVLEVATQLDPDASYVRYDLAQSLITLGDDARAARELEETVGIARSSKTYDLRLGFAERDLALIAMREGRYDDVVEWMTAALDDYRWPYLPLAHETLAEAYDRLGRADDAQDHRRRESFLQGR